MPSKNKKALDYKAKGNKLFAAKKYRDAIKEYTQAIKHDGTDETFFSNRSAAYLALGDADNAAADGKKCIELKPDWVKGYYRAGMALAKGERHSEAIAVFKKGLEVDPANNDLRDKLKESEKASEFTLPTHDDKGNAVSKAVASKMLGNNFFKNGRYEEALSMYTQAIENAESDEQKVTFYVNRAIAYAQLQDPESVIRDCTAAIDIDDNNAKAYIRRGLARESMEKYKDALEDMKRALELGGGNVASQAIHRLTKAINSLY